MKRTVDETRKQTVGIDVPLPQERYTCVCVAEEATRSKSSGNPMLKRTWEVIEPETITYGGSELNVKGVKVTQYVVTAKLDDNGEELPESEAAFDRWIEDLQKLGVATPGLELDNLNPEPMARGRVADLILNSTEFVQRRKPTEEEIAEAQATGQRAEGQPITDKDGNEIKGYQANFVSLLEGRDDIKVSVPFG